jgi:hypothetical protein
MPLCVVKGVFGGAGVDGALTSAEREELVRLRRECRRPREDVEILKRATAFFVTLKGERLDVQTWPARAMARRSWNTSPGTTAPGCTARSATRHAEFEEQDKMEVRVTAS